MSHRRPAVATSPSMTDAFHVCVRQRVSRSGCARDGGSTEDLLGIAAPRASGT